MAPVIFSAFRMVKAPKIMTTILKPSLSPFQTFASRTAMFSWSVSPLILKYVSARNIPHRSAMGAILEADIRNAMMPTSTITIGLIARIKLSIQSPFR